MLPKRDNYALQADFARRLFLERDQTAMPAQADNDFLYLTFAWAEYRISRTDGHIFRLHQGTWGSADSHGETLTLFDYLCDAKPNRTASGEFATVAALGSYVHQGLSIHSDDLERAIDADPERFCRTCRRLGGVPIPGGDYAFTLKLLPDLPMALRFWCSDEEFPPKLDLLWDKNTLQYLRYETVWYAAGVVRRRLAEEMAL